MRLNNLKRHDKRETERKDTVKTLMEAEEQNSKVLDWIQDSTDTEESHRTILERTNIADCRYADAGKWFFDSDEYSAWHHPNAAQNRGRVLWLKGPSEYTSRICFVCAFG